MEETKDRNEYSDKNPAAVYVVTYTYENIGYVDEDGIMDGLYIGVDNPGSFKITESISSDKFGKDRG